MKLRSRQTRGAVVLGAKTECVLTGSLCACLSLTVFNYPINLNLSSGTCPQCKSNRSLNGVGVCATCANECACVFLQSQ